MPIALGISLGLPFLLNRTGPALPMDALVAAGITPAAWFSPFKGRAAYVGPAWRVRRSSDNAEQDIGFVGGNLDTAALLAFVGAGDGFVTTEYEQMGTGLHAVQATAATQPYCVTAGVLETIGGAPAKRFDSVANSRLISTITPATAALAVLSTFDITTPLSGARATYSSPAGTNGRTMMSTLNGVSMGDATNLAVGTALNTPTILSAAFSGGNMTARSNGVDYGPVAIVRATVVAGFYIGSRTDAINTTQPGKVGDTMLTTGVTNLTTLNTVIAALRTGLVG